MIKIIRKIWHKLNQHNISLFNYTLSQQKKFIDSLPEPTDDIQRSYNQYLCQMFFRSNVGKFILNVLSLPFIFVIYFFPHEEIRGGKVCDAISVLECKPSNIVPVELREKFGVWHDIMSYNERVFLDRATKNYFVNIVKRYPFSWFFLLKSLIKLGNYNALFKEYTPKAIIVCNEYSFTSSMLTNFCEVNGVQHIDVMHGEHLYDIGYAFFRYHSCYVWDRYYVGLFRMLRATDNRFIISLPESMKFSDKIVQKKYDYVYYLGAVDKEGIKRIVDILRQLASHGNNVALRPHPRFTSMSFVHTMSDAVIIEDFNTVTIEESILSTKYVVAKYSAVLNQAYHNGINIVIDDITAPDMFRQLKELHYIMLSVPHEMLSVVCAKEEINLFEV